MALSQLRREGDLPNDQKPKLQLGHACMNGKNSRTAAELVDIIKDKLAGRYADVPIQVRRSGTSWIAVAETSSDYTRERIQAAAKRVRQEYHNLEE